MHAAYELIERDGPKQTSVHDVLDAAGLSTRAFYRHFRSRDELVLEMYRVDCERVNATLATAVAAAPDPVAALAVWIDQNLAVVYDARRLRHAVVLSSVEVSSAEGFTDVKNAGLAEQRALARRAVARRSRAGRVPRRRTRDRRARDPGRGGCAHASPARPRPRRARTRADARTHTLELFRRALGAPG